MSQCCCSFFHFFFLYQTLVDFRLYYKCDLKCCVCDEFIYPAQCVNTCFHEWMYHDMAGRPEPRQLYSLNKNDHLPPPQQQQQQKQKNTEHLPSPRGLDGQNVRRALALRPPGSAAACPIFAMRSCDVRFSKSNLIESSVKFTPGLSSIIVGLFSLVSRISGDAGERLAWGWLCRWRYWKLSVPCVT